MDSTLFEKHTEMFCGDVGMYYCGKRIKTKNHVYGPEIRTHFLIVAVEDGTAVLHMEKSDIEFGSGDVFVMFPGERIFYEAKTDWSIRWIGVSGDLAGQVFDSIGVTRYNPIFRPMNFDSVCNNLTELYNIEDTGKMFEKCRVQMLLYKFFSELLPGREKKRRQDPIVSALQIIKYNYNNEISVKSIADSLYFDSAYFSRLFKERMGILPTVYIREFRIKKAKELLLATDYSIKDIAATVGFHDSLYFSKVFSRSEGVSPSKFREERILKN